MRTSIVVATLLLSTMVQANETDRLGRPWQARWISTAGASPYDFGVYHFRRSFTLDARPARFLVHVSADNRYQLFVNGTRVAWGPARGDLHHWRYETVDLAPQLRAGRNVLAAVVWNGADLAPVAQIWSRTGFLLEGDTTAESVVNTGQEWKSLADPAYAPLNVGSRETGGYTAVGFCERFDAARAPWNWEQPGYDDSAWQPALAGQRATGRETDFLETPWMLVPRTIPMMEEKPQRLARLRQATGVTPPAAFPAQPAAFTVPAHTRAVLVLDQSFETVGYPELVTSGGQGARVQMLYAEAPWNPDGKSKGNRDQIEGKRFRGLHDIYLADGGARRLYRPLWWRTWRYIELTVETAAEPLTIEDLRSTYTGYPLTRRARFEGGPADLGRILDLGWHTARLCAHETYMDCPYYEQLQYAGDTRIQAQVTLFNSGDGRLVRNAIEQLDDSRTSEGATFSRAPSGLQQYIPPFSLWWIGMVHDYWMYQDDEAFVRRMMPGVRAVLGFFASKQKANGSLGRVPWWNFVDWAATWRSGVPPAAPDGPGAPLDLQLLLAYQWAAALEQQIGSPSQAAEYTRAAAQLSKTIRQLYWDSGRQLLADTPDHKTYSQHVNALAVLAGVVPRAEAGPLMERVLTDASLTRCTIYFKFYLYQAMRLAGGGDRYLDQLGEWRDMLSRGLTTLGEMPEPTRSDCHAWGASPNIEVFRTVLGIDSAAPGFRHIRIQPNLGKLERASGLMPHPKGEISVRLARRGAGLEAVVRIPAGTTAEFVWQGQTRQLAAGEQKLTF
jgi:hypothetical protein